MNKKKGESIFIIPSPPDIQLHTTNFIWHMLNDYFKTVYILINKNSNWTILQTNSDGITKYFIFNSYKHKIRMEFISIQFLLTYKNSIDNILLYQSSYSILTTIIAKILRKKVFLFLGGSRYDVFKANISFKPYGLLHAIKYSPLDFFAHYFTLFFVDKLILISPTIKKDLFMSLFKSKIFIATNFPDKTFYSIFKSIKNIDQRELIIGYIGTFRVIKGIHLFIQSIPFIKSKNSAIKFIIISDTKNCEPKNLYKLLKPYFEENNITLIEHIDNNNLINFYNSFKLLILPSYSEGLPAVVMESIACKTPVLCRNVGLLNDIIIDNKTGFILKSDKPEHIADQILSIIKNDTLLNLVSEEAYNYIKQCYNYESSKVLWGKIFSP